MQFIKIIYESACKAFIRFWDNRFHKSTEVEYYRMQIENLRLENKELQDRLFNVLSPKTPIEMNDEPIDWKPMPSQVPWHVKRQQLELESYNKAKALKDEAIATLEKSVGIS